MRPLRGMSFMDVVIGTALMLIIFLALFGLLRASLIVTAVAKAKAGATAVAGAQMEYLRSLSYDSLGTEGGIPAGVVPQEATTNQNGIPYAVRTFIEYEDDEADGLAGADHNGITTDYKRLRVSVTYTVHQTEREVVLVSNAAPPGIETTTGGGTLRVDVVDAAGVDVAGASVHIVNDATSPAIDLTTFSDALGTVMLGGAPTSTEYQVYVEKSGYSSAETYERDATNQNPTPGYMTVVANTTTTGTFAIDLLATFTLRTFSPPAPATWTDSFDDADELVEVNSIVLSGGALALSSDMSGYVPTGDATSTTTAPARLVTWSEANGTLSAPLGTEVEIRVLDGAGALIPDAILPGNGTGFTSFPIDLSTLATSTYPALALKADLSSFDSLYTPTVSEWSIGYEAGPTPLPNVPFTLTGSKTVGSTGAGAPIYKTTVATSTDANGERALTLEWDVYELSLPGYSIVSEDPASPYQVLPGTASEASLVIE